MDKGLGEKCVKDEFEFHAVKDEYQTKLENDIKNFDFNKIYYIDQSIAIDKYDFATKGFPIEFMKLNKRGFLEVQDFYCSIPNLKSFSLFSIAPDKAKRVNKLRYGNNSYPSNLIYARCYFKFLDQKMEIKRDKMEIFDPEKEYRDAIVGIEIVGMEFYTEPHVEYNYLGSAK